MNHYRPAAALGLSGALALAGCSGGGGDYATKGELDSLRAQYVATHDTMRALWQATDSMNRLLEGWIQKDTTPIPPKCPPRCLNMIPGVPAPGER